MITFEAHAVNASEIPELDVFVVVLAEEPDGSGRRLELQRALEIDEQDRELGQDTYCVCTEDGACCYGGVASWSLVGDELRILLDARAATTLGVTDGFVIRLRADAEALHRVSLGLRRLLDV
jgi:hypothetical protein